MSAVDEADMAAFAEQLASYQPTSILAYANTLGLFASYLKSQNIRTIRPHSVITTAEILSPENRKLIEEVFDCPVFNRYGSRETSVIASECEYHQGMHINAENLIVEAGTNEDSEVLITDLKNYAMPLIRYRIKDVGRLLDTPCKCGRGLPLMELSGGRVSDYLTAESGKQVSGLVLVTYVITRIPGVRQVQLAQSQLGALTIRLVRGPAWSNASQAELVAKTKEFMGNGMRIEMDFCENIPFEKSGKYRFAVSTLPSRFTQSQREFDR